MISLSAIDVARFVMSSVSVSGKKSVSVSKEAKTKWLMIVKLLVVITCAWLYSAGGCEGFAGKWLRRYLAPSLAYLSIFLFSKDWRVLLVLPLTFITLSMGYGADTLFAKIGRRSLFALLNGITMLSYIHIPFIASRLRSKPLKLKSHTLLYLIYIGGLISAYNAFGVLNPFGNARVEETVLGLCVFAIPVLVDYKREKI